MFHALPPPLHAIVPFVIVLGILVFIHELGHYLAARWRGVFVEAFSIGFGRPVARWRDRAGTEWRLSWLPLGGYVKLHGQERPEDATPEQRAAWQPGRTFHGKSVLSRAIVIAAGPLANFLLAIVLYAGLFATVGEPVAAGTPASVVGEVQPASAAARAGLLAGDRIVSIAGQPVTTFEDVRRVVSARPDAHVPIQVERAGTLMSLDTTLDHSGGDKRVGTLGITAHVDIRPVSVARALIGGVTQTWEVGVQTLAGLWAIATGHGGADEIGGPLRIAQLSGQVAELGLASMVTFIAVLSINLGLINLFPVPVLDGGHLVFYAIEAVRGRPLPPRAVEYGFRAGFALLAALFVFATWNDLSHLGLMRWVASLIGNT